jgi:hypothetical protein
VPSAWLSTLYKDQDDAKFKALCERCAERISRLKALHLAWETFCLDMGIEASAVEKMSGLPFLGSLRALDLIEEILGEIAPNEDYQRECLDHMKTFWNTKLEDRYAALG